MDPLIVLFGFGVGVLIGLTGIGGGSLMTPMLILVFGTQPVIAIGTDLAYGALTKTLGGWRHLRARSVDLRLSLWLAVGSLPGAVAGVVGIQLLRHAYGDDFEPWLMGALSFALFLAGGAIIVRALFHPSAAERERDSVPMTSRNRATAVAFGATLGVVLGLTSVGSGALVGLVLIVVFRLVPRRVVGTDVFHAAMLLWVAGLTNLAFGNVDYGLMANILVGSLPGVWLGASLLPRVPHHGLRVALGIVLFASAFGILQKAGVDVGLPVIIGVPVALGVVAWIVMRSQSRHRAAHPAPAQPQTNIP